MADPTDSTDDIEPADVRDELDRQRAEAGAGVRSDERMDAGLIDLLSRALDTDTRTRVYVFLRRRPHSTVEEVAEGTGLYPGAVSRVLSEFHDERVVERRGGEEPTYTAARPDELLDIATGRFRDELEDMFSPRRGAGQSSRREHTESVTIPVEEEG
jgi:DNA-binding transcriptional ArsR family regulator